jgi:hypothetical protein
MLVKCQAIDVFVVLLHSSLGRVYVTLYNWGLLLFRHPDVMNQLLPKIAFS